MKGTLRKVADLSSDLSGLDILSFGIGAQGEALVAAAKPADAQAFQARLGQPGGASFAATRITTGHDLVVVIHDGKRGQRLVIRDQVLTFPLVQTAPGGRLLIAGPRCRRSADGSAELNGRLYSDDGRLEDQIILGDGISHVQVTGTGKVWVGYSDEGVYGNFGWGVGKDSTPIGSSELVRFDLRGEREWEFAAPDGFGPIDDCYALNVASDAEVWTCYYSDFPLVRVGPGNSTRGWRTGLAGVGAVVVSDDSALLIGGYGKHRNRCRIGRLNEGELGDLRDVELELETGLGLPPARFAGRGRHLHALTGSGWFRSELAELTYR